MEDAPRSNEDSSAEDDSSSSPEGSNRRRQRRAEAIGLMAIDREQAKAEKPKETQPEKPAAETKDWWKTLGGEAKPEDSAQPEVLAAPVGKEEAPLKGMADEEKQHVTVELVEQLPPIEADEQQAETDPEAAADLADEIFREEIKNGATMEEAEETVETLVSGDDAEAEPDDEANNGDAGAEDEPSEASEETIELNTPDSDDEDDPAATTGSGSGGGTTPPVPPPSPAPTPAPAPTTVTSPLGGGPPSPIYAPGATPPTPAVAPLSPAVVPRRERYEPDYAPQSAGGAFLLGGILGYLLGRRRGRIKTEKKLLPIQKKLEQEVTDLQWDLLEKQQKVRQLAREKAEQSPVVIERLRERAPVKSERRVAPEATQLHGAHHERIGKMLVGAERQPDKPEVQNIKRHIETLSRADLMELAAKINVEGTTLRQIYETHLIGERGLRRLVIEHLEGRDIRRFLRQEITERQIDFERDPVLRDSNPATVPANVGSTTLQGLLQQVDSQERSSSTEEAAVLKARSDFESKQQANHKQKRRFLDLSLAAIIIILAVLVVTLLLTRG